MDAASHVPFVSLRGISKRYEHVQALLDVDIDFQLGRCHALVGENGAGKSTLIKTVGGVVRPDRGTLRIDDRDVELQSPAEALRRGISIVPQELIFVPHLSVAENICLGDLDSRAAFVKSRKVESRAQRLLGRLGVEVDVAEPMGSFGPAVQQLAMIARGLARDARLLVLDEPTASLSDQETEHLFQVLDDLKASGIGLVYVSHRMSELRRVAEDVTVLRDGERVASWLGEGVPDEDTLIAAMTGRSLEQFFSSDRRGAATGRIRLHVENLSRRGVLDNVSFSVAAGEVVALSGLMGAGRTEVLRCLVGCDRPDSLKIWIDEQSVDFRTPAQAKKAGMVLVPEERKTQGLVELMSVSDNISLPHLSRWSRSGFIAEGARRREVEDVGGKVGLKVATYQVPANHLSGGNQQKVVLAKTLIGNPRIILLDEPTRGIDVAVKHDIYTLIGRLADSGCAVVVVSSEMPEVLGLADRIVVLRDGAVTGTLDRAEATEQEILRLAMPDIPSSSESR